MPCVRVGQGKTYIHEEQAFVTLLCPDSLGPWKLEYSNGSPAPGKKQLSSAQAASPELMNVPCTQEAQSVNAFHSVNTRNKCVCGTNSIHSKLKCFLICRKAHRE